MYCSQCGKEIKDIANFCTYCGARVETISDADPHETEYASPRPGVESMSAEIHQPSPPLPLPPPEPLDAIDSVRAVNAIFKDPKWLGKILLGGVVLAIPFIGFLIILPGYGLMVVNRVARGMERQLPEWNIGECMNKGGALFIYNLSLFMAAMMVLGAVRPAFSALHLLDSLYGIFALSVMGMLWLYMLAAYAFAGAENNPGAVFHFGRILDAMIDNPAPLLIILILNVASLFLAFSGMFGFYVCVIFTASISAIFMSHIAGQFYRVAHTAARRDSGARV